MDGRGRHALLVLAALLVVATLATGPAAAAEPRPDPEEDVIGWENGYWHDDPIDVDQSDGLSDAELAAYVNRTMARIEVLREREFTDTVPVSIVDRADYGNETRGNASADYRAWNNQVWEALFIVGEDRDIQTVLHSTATAATTGAYVYSTDEIQIITDSPSQPTIGRGTLAHELVHAQQDQYANLSNATYRGATQDEQLAVRGLVEGEANYLEARYEQRCGESWDCVASPLSIDGGGGGGGDSNTGVLVTLFQPYSDGPVWVHDVVERAGWAGVDAAFETPPDSTEQIIHLTTEAPRPLDVEDTARAGWVPFADEGVNGTDTAGEASMFAMLWYQSSRYGANTVSTDAIFETSAEYDTYNYAVPETTGWANDAILPYRRATATGPEYGYVWVTEWDRASDAEEFHRAYRAILRAHDARSVGEDTWVIDRGPFADAFRVIRDGQRVTIVNAPERADLDELRPALAPPPTVTTTLPAKTPAPPEPGSPMEPTEPAPTAASPTEAPPQPGFGPLAALAGLALGGWLTWRRRG